MEKIRVYLALAASVQEHDSGIQKWGTVEALRQQGLTAILHNSREVDQEDLDANGMLKTPE